MKYAVAMRWVAFDAEEYKRNVAAQDAKLEADACAPGLSSDERVRRLRLLLTDSRLLTRCPRCAFVLTSIVDGCNATRCAKCGAGFCALCLEDCGRDAHAHFGAEGCPKSGEDIFDEAAFGRCRRARALTVLTATVQSIAGEGRALQSALVEALSAELAQLGIDAEEILPQLVQVRSWNLFH
jgi:hypothetical protein